MTPYWNSQRGVSDVDVGGVDLVERREPGAGQIEIVQRPVHRLAGVGPLRHQPDRCHQDQAGDQHAESTPEHAEPTNPTATLHTAASLSSAPGATPQVVRRHSTRDRDRRQPVLGLISRRPGG